MPSTSSLICLHQWHCRVHSQHQALWRDVLIDQIKQAIDESFSQQLRESEELVLIRQVNLRFCGLLAHDREQEFAKEFGRAVSLAISQAIDRGEHGTDVKHYASRAHHLADFAMALIEGNSVDAWYFSSLKKQLTEASTEGSGIAADQHLDRFIDQVAAQWPALSRVLISQGRLIAVLRRLSSQTAERVLKQLSAPSPTNHSSQDLRPIFAAASEVLQCLTEHVRSSNDLQMAWRDYVRLPHPDTDWQDPTHLAEAVCHAMMFLKSRWAVVLTEQDFDRLKHDNSVLDRFDWLDQDWLEVRLKSLICKVVGGPSAEEARALPASPFVPSRREQDWRIAWQRVKPTLMEYAREQGFSEPALKLAASAFLLEQLPGQASDAYFEQFIGRMVAQLPLADTPIQPPSPRQVATQSEIAKGLSRNSIRNRASSVSDTTERSQSQQLDIFNARSGCVGAWLLLRSLHDLRLPALCRRMEIPGAASENLVWFFHQLLQHWASYDCTLDHPVVENF